MVQMVMHLADGLWSAKVDPTQIELVILNLAINARDAMPGGGVVTIQTENRHCGPPARTEQPAEGDYVVVTVQDVGTGMTPEVLAKAFEPFFTKGPGMGSGLGLSQVFGTARQSGGDVQIESAPGKGTSVSVFLPRSSVPAAAPAAPQAGIGEVQSSPAAVLVVDDDDAVRTTTADVLNGLGYTVLQAPGGKEALERLHDAGSTIDVLLTDVVMPGMSGITLARRVREQWPQLPIVFISGYAEPEEIAGEQLGRLVRKPFTTNDLRKQLEDAIAETPTAVV
jgi:CheY-like chemotaxis protein